MIAAKLLILACIVAEPVSDLQSPTTDPLMSQFTSRDLVFSDAPGTWVAYLVSEPKAKRYVRFAVVADRAVDGVDRVYFEEWLGREGEVAVKFELTNGKLAERGKLKFPFGIEWVDLPKDRTPCPACGGERSEPQSWASIRTPAGTFRAMKVGGSRNGKSGFFWKSPEVPLLGVARFDADANLSMELVAVGHDARSAIPEDAPVHSPGTIEKRLSRMTQAFVGLASMARDGGVEIAADAAKAHNLGTRENCDAGVCAYGNGSGAAGVPDYRP